MNVPCKRTPSLVVAFALALLLPISAFCEQMVDRGAKVSFFVGKVTVKKGDEKEWKDVKIGMRLSSKDAIRTYVESKVDIETSEGTLINIMENTVFELTEIFQNARTKANTTTVNVKTGSVWANVKKLTNARSSFTFETPTATAAIRGTELGVDVTQGRTRIQVKSGKVEVKSRSGGKPVYVFDNQEANVQKDKEGVDVTPMKADTSAASKAKDELMLELYSPREGEEISGSTVTLTGKTTPGAIIKVNGGSDITPATDGAFAGSLTLPQDAAGDMEITVAALLQGKTAMRSFKIVVKKEEAQAVILALTEPLEGASVTGGKVQVSGTVTPGATLIFGDGQVTVSKDGLFSVPYKLPAVPGTYPVKVSATAGTQVKTVTVNVSVIELPKELMILINKPSEGEEFSKITAVPVQGLTLPGAKVAFGSGTAVTADAAGVFKGMYDLPKKLGETELIFTAASGSLTKRASVRIKLVEDKGGCAVEILEPVSGSDVELQFALKGKVDNPDGKTLVFVNGMPATVMQNIFTALVSTGFQKNQGGQITLTVTEPKPGVRLIKLPVMIRGKVFPPMAKVLLDGSKEARVASDGAFEAEYPMSDETGDYDLEVSAITESGQDVKKKFDVNVQTECNGVRSAPIKATVNVNLGASTVSGEKKVPISFHYEKQKYPLQLIVSSPMCVGEKIIVEVKTTAVELKCNDKVLPLTGAGGTLRSTRYEIGNSDRLCFNETEVIFTANDESAEPTTKEERVTWSCPRLNLEKPLIQFTDQGKCLSIKVFDKSFLCEKSEEDVLVTVEATGEGQIEDFEVTSNGGGFCVPFINGVNIIYTIKATDKGKNQAIATYTKPGYMDRQVIIRMINPPSTTMTLKQKISPPPPPGGSDDEMEIPISFRIEGIDIPNPYRLIKRVEFRPSVGTPTIYEGANIPTDLQFDDIILRYNLSKFRTRGSQFVISYTIIVTDILGNQKPLSGSITVIGTTN
jgi:hypothetical protein